MVSMLFQTYLRYVWERKNKQSWKYFEVFKKELFMQVLVCVHKVAILAVRWTELGIYVDVFLFLEIANERR